MLWMASFAARGAAKRGESSRDFVVLVPRRNARGRKLGLRIVIGPSDHAEPVVTIGFPSNF